MIRRASTAATLVALIFASVPMLTFAQSSGDIQRQIDEQNARIADLDKEIAQYQKQLNTLGTQKQTLQNRLSEIDLNLKKTNASISATKNKINSTQLQIQQLSGTILTKQESIDLEHQGLASSLRRVHEFDNTSAAVLFLSSDNIGDAWRDVDALSSMQDAVQEHIKKLSSEKRVLTDSKTAAEAKRKELLTEQAKLTTLQGSLSAQKKAQNELLTQTKSQESTYQALLAQKRSAKATFEAALSDLKSAFKTNVTPSQVPSTGKGILRWPVDNVRITQYFGNTAFAAGGAYGGKGHNGIDFAAPIGTPIRAALTGVVAGTGNTDAVRGCYSFGKWVMIKHANGLSTMYAHLSQVNVSQGQSVSTGQVIGYAGETGYATGPHLHFGVYLTATTQIINLGSATNSATPCSNAVMPVTPLSGYLNPVSYLP